MSFRSHTNSFVEHVRGFIHRPTHHAKQNSIQLGSLDATDVLGSSLHKEAIHGSRRALKKVLLSGLFFHRKCQEGVTPTHAACCVGNVRLLGKLIEAGGDLRLHDNDGYSVRDWALQNPDPKQRAKMLQFLNKTHIYAMAYIGDAASADHFTTKYAGRGNKQTSLMELMKMRTGSDSTFENLKRVQSMGFGKVYLGGDFSGGIISVVPLVNESMLAPTESRYFESGFGTYIEQMKWIHMEVSVKKVRSNVEPEEGIDNIIAEAEFLGRRLARCLGGASRSLNCHATVSRVSSFQVDIGQAVFDLMGNLADGRHAPDMVQTNIKADLGKASRVSSVSHGRLLFNWMAPELMREEAPHFSSDIYSFCCIMWELFAGEAPWAGLKAQDVYKKVVEENIPLDLNYARLPSKFKAIVGYGLELHEEDRLHKFSLISEWLRSEEIPKFYRSDTLLQWANKSSNHVEVSTSSSPSSSILSVSSKVDTAVCAASDCGTQDSDSWVKSDKEQPPKKPPRSFAYGYSHDSIKGTYESSERKTANTESKKAYQVWMFETCFAV
ncbi:inactive serine/threonine-protein kinase TEX14 [Elysia marginata]|uniref:Inactive serine/threonine-protein kinase TEX14 n=1 Tax=Elysia marginata TaxID=1093978 RepID=A0AAV4K2V4_9GAST|nr:inactive serine/threonine-protein kinase TEX14 [Elysia marginata]